MSLLKDLAIQYIESEKKYEKDKKLYHYNCAEILLNSSNDYYKMDIDPKFLKAIIPFGGGIYSERTCGALTGAIAALGIMYGEDKPTTNEKLKEITLKWLEVFEKEFGSLDCKDIKAIHRDEVTGCRPVIVRAAEMFEEIAKSYETA